ADINAVRARAHARPVDPADVNIDYLLDERIRELYGEENRHFVLRRTGKLLERVRKYNNNPKNPGLNIQDYNILWPIPQTQLDLNIGAKWEQNPGY
ncbi:MAG: RagB/SusD family nutrient uptake outer membrane protein, partial [Parabacteroides sp.]